MMKFNLEDILSAIKSADSLGFCLECGQEHDGIEPDARKYKCEKCGAMKVYGAEEVLLTFTY
jgi:Zn finger protein HypA/HybF involved in hydrogenase expression